MRRRSANQDGHFKVKEESRRQGGEVSTTSRYRQQGGIEGMEEFSAAKRRSLKRGGDIQEREQISRSNKDLEDREEISKKNKTMIS